MDFGFAIVFFLVGLIYTFTRDRVLDFKRYQKYKGMTRDQILEVQYKEWGIPRVQFQRTTEAERTEQRRLDEERRAKAGEWLNKPWKEQIDELHKSNEAKRQKKFNAANEIIKKRNECASLEEYLYKRDNGLL